MSWKRKNELEGRQFWKFLLNVLNRSSSILRCCGSLGLNLITFGFMRMFFFPNLIFLIKIWSRGLAATLWLCGTTHTERRNVQDSGSGGFCRPRRVKSSKANKTPPTWLHFPFPCKPSPADRYKLRVKHHTEVWTRRQLYKVSFSSMAKHWLLCTSCSREFCFQVFLRSLQRKID